MKTALILGAGIVGLATALELASRGVEVTVIERGEAMREASWAAAGMLAAGDPENPPQLAALARRSLALYPDFLRKLEKLSGYQLPLRTTQTLQICHPKHTSSAGHIELSEALQRVPGLPATLPGPLLWLDEQSLDPRDLCRALPVAARAAGVRIHEHCRVLSVRSDAGGIAAVTGEESFHADCAVACSGAWIDHFEPLAHALYPVKGQMLAVRPSQSPILRVVLRSPEVYLVPRGDGRIIIGATVEDAGFDRAVDPAATTWLLTRAAALWPPIYGATVEEVWTGLRPGTPDGLPLIGPVARTPGTSHDGMWIAAGHYRNGILLAPATAELLADAILHAPSLLAADLADFDPARFAPAFAVQR